MQPRRLLSIVSSAAIIAFATASNGYRRSRFGCEGTELQLSCEAGTVISPVRANYGRFSLRTCNSMTSDSSSSWSTRCIQPTSLRQVSALCAGQPSCSIDVTSSVFGDPCPGTYKYLEVHYTCVRPTAAEHGRAEQQFGSLATAELPPWLLKMTATTRAPQEAAAASTTSAASTSSSQETTTPAAPSEENNLDNSIGYQISELLQPRYELVEDLTIVYDDDSSNDDDDDTSDEENESRRREVFINLPLSAAADGMAAVTTTADDAATTANDQTVLVASLTSVIACCLVVLLMAVIFTRIKKKGGRGSSANSTKSFAGSSSSSIYQQYRPQYVLPPPPTTAPAATAASSSVYEYSSGNSIGSIYTTLPNGQQALVIPIHNSSHHQILSHLQFPTNSPFNAGNAMLQSTENIYFEIDPKEGRK